MFDVAGALDLEAFGANLSCLHPVIEQTRPFPGLAVTLHQLRLLLAGSYLWHPGAARLLQDPLTFRCIPHIHGAARDALDYARNILQLELNSSQSNPVVVVPAGNERGRIVSVGNFDTGPLAAALDFLRIALASVVTSANERAVKLLQAPYSGLPAGLAALSGSPDTARATRWMASSRSSPCSPAATRCPSPSMSGPSSRSASTPAGTGRWRRRCGDIIGQVTGQPVSVLFGGASRGLPAYARSARPGARRRGPMRPRRQRPPALGL
jgi:histidine ammonia-lyase